MATSSSPPQAPPPAIRREEARYLVSDWLAIGERCASTKARLDAGAQPRELLAWLFSRDWLSQWQIGQVLERWAETDPAARWAMRAAGVGPVVAAGFAAHVDIARCGTVSSLWRFAGCDPHVRWTPGAPCPWNRDLKAFCSMVGDLFAGPPTGFYGRRYLDRKRTEQQHNKAGRFARQARAELGRAKPRDARWYAEGQLPPEHIEARAKRWTVKLFLAHIHHVAWAAATGTEPPRPFVVAVLGGQFIPPPEEGTTA